MDADDGIAAVVGTGKEGLQLCPVHGQPALFALVQDRGKIRRILPGATFFQKLQIGLQIPDVPGHFLQQQQGLFEAICPVNHLPGALRLVPEAGFRHRRFQLGQPPAPFPGIQKGFQLAKPPHQFRGGRPQLRPTPDHRTPG